MRKLKINIYPLMAEKDIRTVTELSSLVGLTPKALYGIMNGKTKRIDFETITKLCSFFECNVSELMTLEEKSVS